MKKIIILGGGISGLACAYFLPKHIEKIVFEKEKTPGGLLRYPRGFAIARSQELLALCRDLHLESNILFSAKEAKRRLLLVNGVLHPFPGFLGTPWSKSLLKALLLEWKHPPVCDEETIYHFAKRRFGKGIAETLFDAIAVGVFGGDSRELSCNACFPFLKEAEMRYGSLTKAWFKTPKKKDEGLFSLQGGPQVLAEALAEKLGPTLRLEEEVLSVDARKEGVAVTTNKGTYEADLVISALPPQALHADIPLRTLYVITCSYEKQIALPKAFGYVVPRSQNSPVLGVCFDTQIFPQKGKEQFTIMTEGPISTAVAAVQQQLQIPRPDDIHVCCGSIPQYTLGHKERIESLQAQNPFMPLLGNYLGDVSVNGCVRKAKELVYNLFEGD